MVILYIQQQATGGAKNMQEKLLLLRNRHGYSQKYIAEYLGISSKQYSSKERGEYEFKADEMFKLSDLFNERIEDVFMPRGHQIGDKEII